jgi:hypothetical protein
MQGQQNIKHLWCCGDQITKKPFAEANFPLGLYANYGILLRIGQEGPLLRT